MVVVIDESTVATSYVCGISFLYHFCAKFNRICAALVSSCRKCSVCCCCCCAACLFCWRVLLVGVCSSARVYVAPIIVASLPHHNLLHNAITMNAPVNAILTMSSQCRHNLSHTYISARFSQPLFGLNCFFVFFFAVGESVFCCVTVWQSIFHQVIWTHFQAVARCRRRQFVHRAGLPSWLSWLLWCYVVCVVVHRLLTTQTTSTLSSLPLVSRPTADQATRE